MDIILTKMTKEELELAVEAVELKRAEEARLETIVGLEKVLNETLKALIKLGAEVKSGNRLETIYSLKVEPNKKEILNRG